jgi:glycerophosphoryl diester phosphodiesterase
MREWQQSLAMAVTDAVTALYPRRKPGRAVLEACRIISHRGEHDNVTVVENTLPAYARARNAGVWGIEADIRWTRDLVPVICHDPDGRRLFGCNERVAELDFSALRQRMPDVPSLAELIEEFGGNTHLMLELKREQLPDPSRQKAILRETLSCLRPQQDFHMLALDPDLFSSVDFLPPATLLPVAETRVSRLSQISLERGYRGLSGHYLLLGEKTRRRHEAAGQRIGTGFVGSRNCLYRELNRGVTWIFSNDAAKMQRIVDECLGR